MKWLKFVIAVVVIFMFSVYSLWADTLQLKDGSIIRGTIKEENEKSITIETSYGSLTIEREKISETKKDKPSPQGTDIPVQEIDLNDEQKKVYNRSRLSIELEGVGIGSQNLGFYSAWRKWTAYEGFNLLSEESFFMKTGYQNEAKRAKEYKKKSYEMQIATENQISPNVSKKKRWWHYLTGHFQAMT